MKTDDDSPSEVRLRLTEDAAVALDALCRLGFADDRAAMAVIWVERWSRHIEQRKRRSAARGPEGPHEPVDVTGLAHVKILETYQAQPVELPVRINCAVFQALHTQGMRLGAWAPHVASAIVNEHGRHVVAGMRRSESEHALIPSVPQPCWCAPLD